MDHLERMERRQELATAWLAAVRRVLLAVALLFSLAQHAFLASYRVSGSSMAPSFEDGDRVVVARVPGFFGEPRRGETVIACVRGETVIKRVAGLPGETIELGGGILRCDGRVADDAVPAGWRDGSSLEPRTLGPDEYFLLGDHRRVSVDSREFGPVPRGSIVGRVILRVPHHGASFLTDVWARD
jgi:signal peptidase I